MNQIVVGKITNVLVGDDYISYSKVNRSENKFMDNLCCNPTFGKSVGMTLTLPKWGLGSPLRLLKL